MACTYINKQGSTTQKITSPKPPGSMHYMEQARSPQLAKGLDGLLDPNFLASIVKILGMS